MSITLTTKMESAAFNSALGRYMKLTKMLPADVLNKKGGDLGIRLYKRFSAVKFGGPGKKRSGLAKAELAARTASGKGTKVRTSLRDEYLAARKQLRRESSSLVRLMRLKQSDATQGVLQRLRGRSALARIGLWQSTVRKEVSLRQKGIGALASSFLWYRSTYKRRYSVSRGGFVIGGSRKEFVRNRTGKAIGYIETGDNYVRIVSNAPGIDAVDRRHGIVASALSEATADTLLYVRRKEREAFARAFAQLGV